MKQGEKVALMALLMSFTALAIDAMLPALGQISASLSVSDPNDAQLVITSIFAGMGVGLVFYGPLSDAYGRKPAIYFGVAVFIVGCLLSWSAASFPMMIFGRVLQGLGAAASRVVTLAMVRDQFEGRAMARVMSLIMIIFILVPALAPTIGQAVLSVGSWRDIFTLMVALAVLGMLWFALRQPETLPPARRRALSWSMLRAGVVETASNRSARGFTLASGLIFGAFVGYLASAQQLFQVQYGLGEAFPYYFGGLALSVGLASWSNSRWVGSLGMLVICTRALKVLSVLSVLFMGVALSYQGQPPLVALMTYLAMAFFCLGLLFGNFNALAVQPLGHIAGIANSVMSATQTLLSALIGGLIGWSYQGNALPLLVGFLVASLGSLGLILWVGGSQPQAAEA